MADEEFGFVLTLDDNISDTLQRLESLSKGLAKSQAELAKIADVSKTGAKEVEKLASGVGDLSDMAKDAVANAQYGNAFKGAQKDVGALTREMAKLRDISADYAQALEDENEEALKAATKRYSETFKTIKKEKKAVLDAMGEQSKKLRKIFVDDKKKLDDFAENKLPENLGKGIGNAIKSALSGDLGGVIGGLGQGAGSVAQLGAGRVRNASQQRGMRRQMMGKGPVVPGGGAALAGMAKFAKFLGPLAIAVGGLGAVVKLLMDAEAQTKELNKELLNQVPYFSLARDGFGAANDRLAQMREVATDFSRNIRLGMDPKMHYEVINALDEHGANLMGLESNYNSFGDMAADVIETVRVTSLNLGTSLGETAAFVAQLRDVHGRSMSEIKSDLSLVVGLSREAGISTKKFFGTISQLSGQMGLYNFKLEDAAQLLTQMNKIMDSKSAEAFTTQMVTGLKDMNAQQRMQTMILAGQGKVRKMAIKASNQMFDELSKDAGAFQIAFAKAFGDQFGPVKTMEDLKKAVREMSRDEKNRLVATVQNELGEESSRRLSAAIRMSENARRGGLSLVDAMSDLGAMDSMEIQIQALENVFGSIEKVPSILAESMGVNQDQLRQMQRFSEISKGQFSLFQAQIEQGRANGLSQAEQAAAIQRMSEKLGYSVKLDEKSGKLVDEQGNEISNHYDLLENMTKEQKEEVAKSADQQLSAAERQVRATQSLSDIMKYLIADLLNSIGSQLTFINEIMLKWFGSATDEQKKRSELDSKEAAARGDLMRAQRAQRKAKVSGGDTSMADALVEAAQKRLADVRGEREFFDQNRASLFTEDGTKRGGFDVTMSRMEKAKRVGFKGSSSEFAALEKSAKERAISRTGVDGPSGRAFMGGNLYTVDGKEMTQGEFDKHIAKLAEEELGQMIASRKLSEKNEEIQSEVLETLKKQGKEDQDLTKAVNDTLANRGIALSPQARDAFEMGMMDALMKQQMMAPLIQAGFSRDVAAQLANERMMGAGKARDDAGMQATYGMTPNARQRDAMNTLFGSSEQVKTRPAFDAKILSPGIAPLSFSPGDLVIKENALARAKTGGPGSMLRALGGGGGGGTSGGNYNFNITVNNPNQGDVREEIMRAYEDIKRKEMGGN